MSQKFTLIAKVEKKAVMWNYSMGAELKVERETSIEKSEIHSPGEAAMNP